MGVGFFDIKLFVLNLSIEIIKLIRVIIFFFFKNEIYIVWNWVLKFLIVYVLSYFYLDEVNVIIFYIDIKEG